MACTEGTIEVQTKKCVGGVMVDNPIDINELPCNQAVPPLAPVAPPAGNQLAEIAYWFGRGLAAGGRCRSGHDAKCAGCGDSMPAPAVEKKG